MIKYFRKNGQPAVKLATVSVIEMTDLDVQGVRSFVDNPEGNRRAEKRFVQLVKEHEGKTGNQWSKEDLDDFIENGVYDDGCGYQLLLVHSV